MKIPEWLNIKSSTITKLKNIAIIILIVVLAFKFGCNESEIEIKVPGAELKFRDIQNKVIKDLNTNYKNELDTLENVKNSTKDPLLLQIIDSLIYERRKDIEYSNDLIQELNQFSKLDEIQQENLMNRISEFIARDTKTNRNSNFGIIANSIFYKQELLSAMNKNETQANIIERLERELGITTNEKLFLEQSDSINKNRYDSLSKMKISDSINMQSAISTLESLNLKLNSKLNTVNPVSLESFSFTSPNCRSKKDQSYLLFCVKKIEVKFTPRTNVPGETKPCKLKIVFTLPGSVPGKATMILKSIFISLDEPVTESVEMSEYDFRKGLYIVQVFNEAIPNQDPIEKDSLSIKRWID
jgi:hypothetical protein